MKYNNFKTTMNGLRTLLDRIKYHTKDQMNASPSTLQDSTNALITAHTIIRPRTVPDRGNDYTQPGQKNSTRMV